jgi:hypothetical protein
MNSLVNKRSLKRAAPVFTIAVVFLILSLSLVSAAYVPRTSPSSSAVPTYPVTVTASPKAQKISPGGIATIKLNEKNNGAKSFFVFDCVWLVKTPGSGGYTNPGGCSTAEYAIGAGKTNTYTLQLGTAPTLPPGTYSYKYMLEGYVGSNYMKAYFSKTATFSITVT